MKKAGVARQKVNTKNYDKAVNYGFRKRFNTILKLNNEVNSNVAEKLMAHKNGLDGRYLTPTREECFKEFRKAISDLTINQTKRQEIEIEKQQKKIDEIGQNKNQVELLRQEVDDMKKLLQEQGYEKGKPFGYIMVDEKGKPLYYQNPNETTFKKYPEDKKS